MNRHLDVPSLVTGLLATGFGLLALWILLGNRLVAPIPMWFASVLLIAGVIGLLASLGSRRDRTP